MGGDKVVEVEAQSTSALRTWPMKASVASPVYISYVKDILDFSAKHLEPEVVHSAHLDWALRRLFKPQACVEGVRATTQGQPGTLFLEQLMSSLLSLVLSCLYPAY